MGNIVNRVFESAGPDGKVRGTPQQIIDKYLVLARDAQVSGDRVAAENYLQHAEHYARLLGEAQRHSQETRQGDREDRDDGDEMGYREDGSERQHRRAPAPQQAEPNGLTTIGSDERPESGPVETPEAVAWERAADGRELDQPSHPPAAPVSGEAPSEVTAARTEAPSEQPTAAESEEPPAPKRTRARRKKPPAPVVEASAE